MKQTINSLMILSMLSLAACQGGMKEFKTLKSGLKYKIVEDKKGDKKGCGRFFYHNAYRYQSKRLCTF
ncbi:MAG: hypothetical protein IPN26_18800 [Bacteroidetes bacterium]|nr:hypothetical protein [Bacteroidota bacterium]